MSAEDERDDDREPDDGEVVDPQHQRFGPRRYMRPRPRRGGRWVLGGNEPHPDSTDTIGNSGP